MTEICYLCGEEIVSGRSLDHVPPKQFFAEGIRAKVNLSRLVTIPAHGACNRNFSKDEEYFTWTVTSVALMSSTAKAIVKDHARSFRKGKSVGLGIKTLREFEDRPSGLYLPHDLIIKRVEGARLARIIWKIIRGPYFYETSTVLPESTPKTIELFEPVRASVSRRNKIWEAVKAQPSKGVYPGVFDYKYLHVAKENLQLHAWGLLLWDQVMVFIAHHHPPAQGGAANRQVDLSGLPK
jgi:hypothetical protein